MAPETFDNPKPYQNNPRWQIKIYDGEKPSEEPHVNVLWKQKSGEPKCWRIDLRTFETMDLTPPLRDLPKEFLREIKNNIVEIRKKWNEMYGDINPYLEEAVAEVKEEQE